MSDEYGLVTRRGLRDALQALKDYVSPPVPMSRSEIEFWELASPPPAGAPGIIDVEFEVNACHPEPQLRRAGDPGLTPDEAYLIRKHLGLE